MQKILVFTDGAAKGNPGPGGYGVVILKDDEVVELGAKKAHTTNNEMELMAVVEALVHLKGVKEVIHLYTDSKYVVEGATKWIFGWQKNGWKTKTKTDVLNVTLWKKLATLLPRLDIEWHKIPGHSGLVGNECADRIASGFGSGDRVVLYNGPRSGYTHAIENVTFDKAKANARSESRARQNQKAYSYVSVVDGKIETHATWAECEKRVKGKKAKFKKVFSKEEEHELKKEWDA